MGTVKQLLEIMLVNQQYFSLGLCHWVLNLSEAGIISFKEEQLLSDYIDNNRPHMFSSISAFKQRDNDFYWPKGELQPRIDWINRHIKKLK